MKCPSLRYAGILVAAIVLAGFSGVPLLRGVASFLIVEDPLEHAAAIISLGGQLPFRELEAAELYRAGWAPKVIIVRTLPSPEVEALKALKIKKPQDWELSIEVLQQQGVPASAIVIPNDEGVGTLEELQAVWAVLQAQEHGAWSREPPRAKGKAQSSSPVLGPPSSVGRTDATHATNAERNDAMDAINALPVILVTSKFHTRRTRLTWEYVSGGRSQPIVRAASRDPFDPESWWKTRRFALSVVREYLGLVNYYAGFPVTP